MFVHAAHIIKCAHSHAGSTGLELLDVGFSGPQAHGTLVQFVQLAVVIVFFLPWSRKRFIGTSAFCSLAFVFMFFLAWSRKLFIGTVRSQSFRGKCWSDIADIVSKETKEYEIANNCLNYQNHEFA